MKPAQIRHIQRKFRHVAFGIVLKIAPSLSLLLVGLIFGLLTAIPVYLAVRAACLWGQMRRNEPTWSRGHAVKEAFAFLLGGVSLATFDPIWFKLEITLISMFAFAAMIISGRPLLADTEPFPPASLVGDRSAGIMKSVFIFGFIAAPIANLWLAVQFSDSVWILFRTLGIFLWFGGSAALATRFAYKQAERTAE